MYLQPTQKVNFIAYFNGYDEGSKCDFTFLMSRKLEQKYGIMPPLEGWPEQIEQLAQKLNLDWRRAMMLIAYEVLIEEYDKL